MTAKLDLEYHDDPTGVKMRQRISNISLGRPASPDPKWLDLTCMCGEPPGAIFSDDLPPWFSVPPGTATQPTDLKIILRRIQ